MSMWSSLLDERAPADRAPFHFLMMTSGLALGGAREADTEYRDYLSRTQRIGISIPVLYMRTTLGKAGDWRFDPDFDLTRKCGNRLVAEDNLSGIIRYAVDKRIPVQFILNGGIWGDASCASPQWDLTDHLETDPANCQWTERNHVYADDYLKGLAGSTDSPELARSLTYHVHATTVRRYKRRNLQAAATIVAAFARRHPDLFVGVVLDADTYMNPFLRGQGIFDYNPGMLRQFRQWLGGTGPYATRVRNGEPDLSQYRRRHTFTLAEVNSLAGRTWRTWADVEPPRRLPGLLEPLAPGQQPIWNDPWWNLWDAFRKHVVDVHYDELSTWVHAAGVPRDRIFSAQGLVHDDPARTPFAVYIDSHSQPYDSAGVSIEGAIPRDGHLGAVLYGHTARNDVEMEHGHSLFATIGRMDDGWAIVEYINTDLSAPTVAPDYAMAYRTFRDAFNYGSQQVSAMAWNGSNGLYAGTPGYVAYTSWRNTPAEDAMRDFLVSHADVPRGARLWTFGTPRRADADGWSAERGTLTADRGFARIRPADGVVTLVSAGDQVIRPERVDRVITRFADNAAPARIRVFAQLDSVGDWTPVADATSSTAPLQWPAAWMTGTTIVQRISIELTFDRALSTASLSRVMLYPSPRSTTGP
jgi:hypothetical protein